MKNYYAILEVPVGCSPEEIRQGYRRLAQENLDNADAFAELKEAYEVLTTPARRSEYDLSVWGETFTPGTENALVLLPPAEKAGRCPMGAESHCPVLQERVAPTDKYCPDCGYLLSALGRGSFDLSAPSAPETQKRLEEADGRIHPLFVGTQIAGRENADILLPDKTVSRQHARLEIAENGDAVLEDLNSTNGTQVNDQPLVPHLPRRLADGDRVRFGSILTTLHLPPPADAPMSFAMPPGMEAAPVLPRTVEAEEAPRPDASASAAPARAKLVETREPGPDDPAPREFLLPPGVTTFGRRPENTVVLPGDPYVSGLHAQITAEGDVFRLTDVGSTNGTLKNGERLEINAPVFLLPDDVVVIGGTVLRFEAISEAISAEEISGEDISGELRSDDSSIPDEAAPVKG